MHGLYISSVIFLICFRQENMIRKFESEHGVIVRWTADMDEYKEAMRIANMGKQQIVKQEMLQIARERVFYLSTLANHTGIYIG